MSYDFKDLQKLSEEKVSDGITNVNPRDTTPIGPVPLPIRLGEIDALTQQLAEEIRNKRDGKAVREVIARIAEWSGIHIKDAKDMMEFLEIMYDEYYRQFTDVIKELSEDKDYHSLPEIAGARRGYSTLAESLGNLSVNMINKNLGKLDQTYMSDGFLQQIAGNTPINSVPADYSITTSKYVNGSVTFDKLEPTLSNAQLKNFEIIDSSFVTIFTNKILSGISHLKLYGFDGTKKHKLRLITRSHSSFNYRFIISEENNGLWRDVFDSGSNFTVVENSVGLTRVDHTIGGKRVVMLVDYKAIGNLGVSVSEMLDGTKYIISEECFAKPDLSATMNMTMENKISNGNFIDGKNSWAGVLSTVSSYDGKLLLLANSRLGSAFQNISSLSKNHKYYVSAKVRSDSPQVRLAIYDDITRVGDSFHSGSGEVETLSFIAEPTQDTTKGVLRVLDDRTSAWTQVEIDDVLLIDLTETFGAGDELEVDEMGEFLKTFDGGWFNGEVIPLLNLYQMTRKQNDSHIENIQSDMVAVKNGNSVFIKFKYNDEQNMIIEFGLLGINKIAHMTGIWLEDATDLTSDFTEMSRFLNVGTDWVSPYGLMAENNIVNDFTGTVGGNHGTVGGGGLPTAWRYETDYYVDNKAMKDDVVYQGDKIVITSTHFVSASNTIDLETGDKRDSVEEQVTYTITPNNMEVSVTLKALEDVKFTRYTGLQAQVTPWNTEGYFMLESTPNSYSNVGTAHASADSINADRFVARKEDNLLIGYTNRDVGIGTRGLIDGTSATPFFSNQGKVYMPNVSGELYVNEGEEISWNGGWTFTQPLKSEGVKNAYYINKLGKRVYCVDFFEPGAGFIEVLPEDYNKEIEVIYKDEVVKVSDFVLSKKLKLSSEGYGQLKFTVK